MDASKNPLAPHSSTNTHFAQSTPNGSPLHSHVDRHLFRTLCHSSLHPHTAHPIMVGSLSLSSSVHIRRAPSPSLYTSIYGLPLVSFVSRPYTARRWPQSSSVHTRLTPSPFLHPSIHGSPLPPFNLEISWRESSFAFHFLILGRFSLPFCCYRCFPARRGEYILNSLHRTVG